MRGMAQGRSFAVCSLLGVLLVAPFPAHAQTAAAQSDAPPRTGIYWRNRPSIQLGEHVRLDIRLKLQGDGRTFEPQIDEDDFDFRMRRGGINGEISDHFEFQIERDLYRGGEWRDVYLKWTTHRQFEVSAGRFKVPFGREELVSASDIDFAFRALVSSIIPPARERGVMVNGRFLRRGVTYEVGVFDGDGDNGDLAEPQFSVDGSEPEDIGPSFAARVTATPLRPLAETFGTFRLGFAVGATDVPEGLNSLRGETVYGTDFFERVYVKGRRMRYGVEAYYTPGPFSVAAEWMQAREQRRNQGLGDVDLSDVLTTGWYGSATWMVTGDQKEDFNQPRRPLFRGGIGAIEVAVRFERLWFESAEKVGAAFRNPRAEHILGNRDSAWTFGLNWFPNRWTRVTVNGIREELDDAVRTPLPGTTVFWSGLGRLQLTF